MAEAVKKEVKMEKPNIDDKAGKDAAKATLLALTKTDAQKAAAVKAPSAVMVNSKDNAVMAAPKAEAIKAEAVKPEPVKAATPDIKTEAPKAETKKEADPSKEFVDGIMAEMALKGGSKKRLIKTLAEQYGFDKHKVLFKLRRALITERYAAAHAEGAGGH